MSSMTKMGVRGTVTLRWLASIVLLGALLLLVDTAALWRELQRIPLWVGLPAVVLSGVQVVISAWRWCYTGRRLGLNMVLGHAVQEYYLATFINQVLPGGVLGDVNRALRHGAKAGKRQKAAHAVAIERLSGQLVLALVVGMGMLVLWRANVFKPSLADSSAAISWLPVVLLLAITGGFLLLRRHNTRFKVYLLALRDDLRQALFSWSALPLQLMSSLLVMASYLAVFLLLAVAANYVNSAATAAVLLALCTVLLLSMVVPLTVAGWGVREGVAALLWPLAGLPAEQGVALSVGYGALVFVGSCPGALVLFRGRRVLP
ncbi:MAG: lysylphosphatidylglycerol synthase transmembrane domain-containing protein [Marinobacter sp.]